MKGEERYLLNLLEGMKTRFVIPVYQRNYDWKIEQCKQLFDDLEDIVAVDSESHFFGSIVSQADGSIRVVIDGQQRITTTYLLLLALVRKLKEGLQTSDDSLADMITESYLIDKWHKSERKLKLKLIKDDQAAFEAIYVGDEKGFYQESNITQNYLYFCNRIDRTKLSADELYSAIERLMIIDIELGRDDDAQRIFESLNSTGLDLSEGDKIRNFILMGLNPEKQEEYYETYWNVIEKNTHFDVSSFARVWLASILRKTPAIKRVYTVFKDYVKTNSFETQELLEQLLKYSNYYRDIINASSGNPKIDSRLRRLILLDATVVYPFMLNLFDYWNSDSIDADDTEQALASIETYLFRRWVCKAPTNALNKVFETLHSETLRGVAEGGKYSDVLNRILLSKEGSGHLPDDQEFIDAFEQRDFYRIANMRFYLFDRLENGNSVERVNVVDNLRDGKYSIEHIMPQTLSNSWIQDLGDNYQEVHEKWLNSIANLTLTAYNSKYSNRRFAEKRDMKDGFRESGFRINRFVCQQDAWGEEQLKQRNELMRNKFLELWPMITSEFEWKKASYDEHSLDDDFDFTGYKIAAYSFMGSRFTVKNWVDMICGVLSSIYELDPAVFYKYLEDEAPFPGRYFSSEESNYSFKLGEGIYFNPGSSTSTKIYALKEILKSVGIDYNELSFDLYKKKDLDDPE